MITCWGKRRSRRCVFFVSLWAMLTLPSVAEDPPHIESISPSSVPATSYLLSLVIRIANLVMLITLSWAAAVSFGIDAPLAAFLSYLPLVYLVAALPINVGPLGAVQFAWVYFFSAYGSGEQIIAFQILFSTLLTLGWALRGLPFMGKVSRELREGT